MTLTPRVSVCIANYNGAKVIDACLQSVLKQDCGFPVEIIMHDDASSDASVEHVARTYPQVRLIRSEENVGFCVSNNRMVNVAQGEYILLLNNDAELFPDALRCLMEKAEGIGGPAILGLPQYDAEDGHLIDRGSLFDPFLNPIPNLNHARTNVGMVMGACLWIPKSLWEEIGGFPKWFGSMAEDMYVCTVARLWGFPVQVLPESGFRHWVGHSFGGGKITATGKLNTSVKRRALSERNKSLVLLMSYPSPWVQVIFPLHVFLLCLECAALTLVQRNLRAWKQIYRPCLASLWMERHRLRLWRGKVQNRRGAGFGEYFSVFSWIPYKLKMLIRHGWPRLA